MDLDMMTPLEQADLICAQIRLLADELQDAIGADAAHLAELVAQSVEMDLGMEQYPDSAVYSTQAMKLDRRIAGWIKSRILPLATMMAEQQQEVADDTEQQDRVSRARDMIAEAR